MAGGQRPTASGQAAKQAAGQVARQVARRGLGRAMVVKAAFGASTLFTLALLLYFPKHKIMTLGGELRGARILPYGGWDCEQLVASAPVYGSVKYQEY